MCDMSKYKLLSCLSFHQFERNWLISTEMQASLKHIFIKSTRYSSLPSILIIKSLSLNRPTGHGSLINFIKINRENCEKMFTEVDYMLFHTTVSLNEGQGHSNWFESIHFSGFCHLSEIARNWSKRQMGFFLFYFLMFFVCVCLLPVTLFVFVCYQPPPV